MATSFSYSLVRGIFVQDDPEFIATSEQFTSRFGLIGSSWPDLKSLNSSAPEGTFYKLIFAGRHGQGFHNVAETQYGTEAWDSKWALLTGNGEYTWGPDPYLTDVGIEQAIHARSAWIEYHPPAPELYLCSPLRRALQTFQSIFPNQSARVEEGVRERIDGHTCDFRLPLHQLRTEFTSFDWSSIVDDEDPHTMLSESEDDVAMRARSVLDLIFSNNNAQVVSITTHSGWIKGLGDALGRQRYVLATGGIAPFLIRAARV